MPDAFRLETGPDRLATLTFDLPGKSANVFTREAVAELERWVGELARRTDIACLILLSAKPRIFRAPDFRFGPKRVRCARNIPSTNSRLPNTAPSLKYRTRHFRYSAIGNRPLDRSTVSTSSAFSAPRTGRPSDPTLSSRASPSTMFHFALVSAR